MAFSFGTPAGSSTPTFSFGGAASTPAFGAASAGLAKTASTPLFGATATAPAAAPTPGLFGASSTPAFSFSGAQPAAQTQPSLFGASQPATGAFSFGNAFGGAPAASQPAPSLFGQPQAQPSGQVSPFGFGAAAPQPPDDSAARELQSIKDGFVPAPGNHRFRLLHLFLNVVPDPAARVKPPDVDELAWREALRRAGGPDNPDHLWPVPARGFQDLLRRKAAQDEALREHTERLEQLQAAAAALAARHQAVLREQLERVKRQHREQRQHLLRVLRHIDALEGRFAHARGYRASNPEDLRKMAAQLEVLDAAVSPGGAAGLQGKAEALLAAARLRAGAPGGGGAAADLDSLVDEASLQEVFGILSAYAEALGKMQGVLHRDSRDVAVLKHAAARQENME